MWFVLLEDLDLETDILPGTVFSMEAATDISTMCGDEGAAFKLFTSQGEAIEWASFFFNKNNPELIAYHDDEKLILELIDRLIESNAYAIHKAMYDKLARVIALEKKGS